MKTYNRLVAYIVIGFLIFFGVSNLFIAGIGKNEIDRGYRVSVNRIKQYIDQYETKCQEAPKGLADLCSYFGIELFDDIESLEVTDIANVNSGINEFLDDKSIYEVYVTDKGFYKINCIVKTSGNKRIFIIVNTLEIVAFAIIILVLIYIRGKIIKPFNELTELPYELAKGNLSMPIKEDSNRYFGKFTWGMDVLREHLESTKRRELELQKEKKVLLMSLAHDIKTPLSAIKLYSQALSKNLYKTEEKQREISGNINQKADEIEGLVSEIVTASNDDFIEFEVNNSEFYSGELLGSIDEFYVEKMNLNQIQWKVNNSRNIILDGDIERAKEVIQNIVENAIKYGDGKKIWIDTVREEDEFIVDIKNTGCEFEAKDLPHIFDSFYRGSNVGNKPGSGLGLYICRKLMHMMNGEIMAYIDEVDDARIMDIKVLFRITGGGTDMNEVHI